MHFKLNPTNNGKEYYSIKEQRSGRMARESVCTSLLPIIPQSEKALEMIYRAIRNQILIKQN